MPLYLADSSIWGWARSGRRPDLEDKLALRLERGELATCVPVALEVMHRARSGDDYERIFVSFLAPLEWIPLTEESSERALDVQRDLAATTHGDHLRPAVDYLIAACAELAGDDTVLWFLDEDLQIICDHTGQPHDSASSGDLA